jgi:hypothetical protein
MEVRKGSTVVIAQGLGVHDEAVERAQQASGSIGARRQLDETSRARLAALGPLALFPRLGPPDLVDHVARVAVQFLDRALQVLRPQSQARISRQSRVLGYNVGLRVVVQTARVEVGGADRPR